MELHIARYKNTYDIQYIYMYISIFTKAMQCNTKTTIEYSTIQYNKIQ